MKVESGFCLSPPASLRQGVSPTGMGDLHQRRSRRLQIPLRWRNRSWRKLMAGGQPGDWVRRQSTISTLSNVRATLRQRNSCGRKVIWHKRKKRRRKLRHRPSENQYQRKEPSKPRRRRYGASQTKKLVKKTPVQPLQPVEAEIQENAEDLEERQDQIHEAEDAIVDESDEEELGEAV
jgi:hypothetical protein